MGYRQNWIPKTHSDTGVSGAMFCCQCQSGPLDPLLYMGSWRVCGTPLHSIFSEGPLPGIKVLKIKKFLDFAVETAPHV